MTGSADGDFGKLTDEGLKLFQQYLYVVEGREYYSPTATPEPTPTPTPSPTPEPTLLLSQGADEPVMEEVVAPTATPYAPDGIVSDALMAELASFEVYRVDMQRGSRDTNELGEVHRLQTEQQRQQLRLQRRQYNEMMKCPRCGSTSLSGNKKGYGIGKGVVGAALFGPFGLVAGNIGAGKVKVTCMKCGYRFVAGRGK